MRIQHNIMAMNAYRNYNNNVSAMKKNLEKLSSGYKINRAGDDAAGLAISEKMRAQITGLETAQKNAKDGISLVQTAEGALTEVHDMLNRMVTLATQSANGTYDNDTDRLQLQKELDQLRTEIDRIADSSNFNGIKLLDGNLSTSSASPMTSADIISSIDGQSVSAGSKAKIEFTMSSGGANPTATKTGYSSLAKDGLDMDTKGTQSKITLTMGGVGSAGGALTITGTFSGSSTGSNLSGTFSDGDTVTVSDGGSNSKTYTYATTPDATNGEFSSLTGLATLAAADGFTLDVSTNTSAVTGTTVASKLTGFANSGTLTAGADDVTALKALKWTNSGKTLGDMYDIKITRADGTTVAYDSTTTSPNDSTVIQNGDTIELTAKYGGEIDSGDKTIADAITEDSSNSTLDASLKGKGQVTTDGVDEGSAAPAGPATVYELKFDFTHLSAGQSFAIGDNWFIFENEATATADDATNGKYYINLHDIEDTDSQGDIWNEVADAIKDKLANSSSGVFKNEFTGTSAVDASDSTGKTYTITLKQNSSTTTLTSKDVNLGKVRLSANTDHSGLLTTTYTPVTDSTTPTVQQSSDQFAQVGYKLDYSKIKAGSAVEINGKTVNIVASTSTEAEGVTGTNTYTLKLESSGSVDADKLANAFEQLGMDKGKLTFDTANNQVIVKGTDVGQTAAALKTSLGDSYVKFKEAPATPPSVQFEGASARITADTSKISDLKDMTITLSDGSTFKVGDVFDIKVNGSDDPASDNDVIGGSQKITLEAKNVGRLDQDVLDKLKLKSGSTTVQNGWDEGTSASGDNTRYKLDIKLDQAAGGNSFTFGNEGDGKSITFDLSYDNKTTDNGTVKDFDTYEDLAGNTRVTINLFGKSDADAKTAIENAIKSTGLGKDFDIETSLSGHTVSLSMVAKKEGAEYNWGQIRLSSKTGDTFANSVYTPAGGAADATPGTFAQISYNFDYTKLKSGDALTIGDKTIYFGDRAQTEKVQDKDKDGNNVGSPYTKITLKTSDAVSDPDLISKAFESAGYLSGQIKFADGKVTITGTQIGETAENLAKNAKISLTNESRTESDIVGGLTLQIGDTAEPFNQLTVDIKDMHAASLGLADISIADQKSAAAAIDVIKDAINKVSDVRGTLGATQNRLDHTINNLSVMTENIQDAESTIRDTDVAEEMMAYTKNNILIQSAQAMLAQANQVPQGVLQLLQ